MNPDSPTHFRRRRVAAPLALAMASALLAVPEQEAAAARPDITASAAYKAKTKRLTISGTTRGTVAPLSTISILDAATDDPLYILKSNDKGKFNYNVPRDIPPCSLRVTSGSTDVVVKVAGSGKACAKAPAPLCGIESPAADQPLTASTGSVTFKAKEIKGKSAASLVYAWELSDGATLSGAAPAAYEFKHAGAYKATLSVTNPSTGARCLDSVMFSVGPKLTNAGLPSDPVPQQPAPSSDPNNPEGLKNDEGSLVVLPYDDMGMQGSGSPISFPYNPYIGYNSLNAQVIKKVVHKPEVQKSGPSLSVLYSAASNPNDPIAPDSINSTSQNWFADTSEAGANWNPLTSTASGPVDSNGNPVLGTATVKTPTSIQFIADHDFASDNTVIRKTEMWDHIRSPIDDALGNTPKGISNADPQSRYIPPASAGGPRDLLVPDQGIPGSSDKATGSRLMPGKAAAYVANDPQPMPSNAFNEQFKAFTAQFLPITAVDDKGRTNPYPLMRVQATQGEATATTDAVLTAADEVGCKECHSKGRAGADDTVWRTPVVETEVGDATNPGPATGAGSFPVNDSNKTQVWPAAIHNTFDGKRNWDPALLEAEKTATAAAAAAALQAYNDAVAACAADTTCQDLTAADTAAKDAVTTATATYKAAQLAAATNPTPENQAAETAAAEDLHAKGTAATTAARALADNALGSAVATTKAASSAATKAATDANDAVTKVATAYIRSETDLAKSPWVAKDGQGNPDVFDQNGLRTDRVAESRWINWADRTQTCPSKPDVGANPGEGSPAYCQAAPAQGSDWKLQIRLKFRSSADVAITGTDDPNSPANRDKAALFNNSLMHDYMVKYGTGSKNGISSQIADYADGTTSSGQASPMYFCSGHHMSPLKLDNGINARAHQSNRSDYSRAMHAFHGKMQVYKKDMSVTELEGAKLYVAVVDGVKQGAKKGELIRDERGHPMMLGGRGWDSQHNDDLGVPVTRWADGSIRSKSAFAWDTAKNNWVDPDQANTPDEFKRLPFADTLFPVGENVAMEKNCNTCHAGKTQHAFRDTHFAAGMKCDNCHGDMLAVGNVYPDGRIDPAHIAHEPKYGFNANLSGKGIFDGESIPFRRPWLDEPDCGSCHTGNGNEGAKGEAGFFSAGVMTTAWDKSVTNKAQAWRQPKDARFAVMPITEERAEIYPSAKDVIENGAWKTLAANGSWVTNEVAQTLYRKSLDVHSSGTDSTNPLTCSSCHGGSHAIWPNPDPNANDNQTAKQLQGFAGNIVECSVCHVKNDFVTGLVGTDGGTAGLGVGQGVRANSDKELHTIVQAREASNKKYFLAGPHGMHPVADESWWKNADGAGANNTGKDIEGLNGGWHNDMTNMPGPDGEDQCAACHGSDHKGTRLSRTLKDRTFVNDRNKEFTVKAGTVIGCQLCHSLKKSFSGWDKKPSQIPKAKPHAPPLLEEPPAPAGLGGGGHH